MLKFNSQHQNIWFTSDTHFGHKNILDYQPNRKFTSVDEMDEFLIETWNSKVKSNDIVFHLGDFSLCSDSKSARIYTQLKGIKYLIRGNHDKESTVNLFNDRLFNKCFDYLKIKVDKQLIVLFHYPIAQWEQKSYGTFHFHGHSHNRNSGITGRYKDVGVDSHSDNSLYSYEELFIEMKKVRY